MRGILILTTALAASAACRAQVVEWSMQYRNGNTYTAGNSVIQDQDGGYVVAGSTGSAASAHSSGYVVKTDGIGQIEWTKSIPRPPRLVLSGIAQREDGAYWAAGTATDSMGVSRVYVALLTEQEGVAWDGIVGEGRVTRMIPTPNRGLALIGEADDRRMLVMSLDATGTPKWTRRFGTSLWSHAVDLLRTRRGDFILVGWEQLPGGGTETDLIAMRLTEKGDSTWSMRARDDSTWERGYSICEAGDETFWIGGLSLDWRLESRFNRSVVWRMDGQGNVQERVVVREDYRVHHQVLAVTAGDDGGVVALGTHNGFTPDYEDVFFGSYLAKVEPSGRVASMFDMSTHAVTMIRTSDGGHLILGYSDTTKKVELTKLGAIPTSVSVPSRPEIAARVIPNPVAGHARIRYGLPAAANVELHLFDVLGREVRTLMVGHQEGGEHEVPFDSGDLAAGLYRCRLTAGNGVTSIPFVVTGG